MTIEEKQLLLKDLCARLPYRVKLGFENSNVILTIKEYCCFTQQLFTNLILPEHNGHIEYGCQFYEYRPYLRPMSSMTDEEQKEVNNLLGYRKTINGFGDIRCAGWNGDTFVNISIIDKYINWLNTHHFDYRRLIEKGLALEAPEGMYKIK